MSLKATQHFLEFLKEFGSQFGRSIKGLLFGFRHFSFTINYEETSSWKTNLSDSKKVTFLKSCLSLPATERGDIRAPDQSWRMNPPSPTVTKILLMLREGIQPRAAIFGSRPQFYEEISLYFAVELSQSPASKSSVSLWSVCIYKGLSNVVLR